MVNAPFYSHYKGEPFFNMAFDDWLLACALEGRHPFAARLYSWAPDAITIGLNQDAARAVRRDRLGKTIVIRRVTGGRAVFHDRSELTYAVAMDMSVASESRPIGSLSATSEAVAEALRLFLRRLGVDAERVRTSSPKNAQRSFFHRAPCFDSRARYELVTAGRKVVASAQRRIANVLLQHGSIKLFGDIPHGALGDSGGRSESGLPELTDKIFHEASVHFREVLAESFGLNLTAVSLDEHQQKQLLRWAANLRKNPFQARQTIKQITCSDSPYSDGLGRV